MRDKMAEFKECELIKHLRLLNDPRNSLLYWYPKVKDLVPTPKTVWLEVGCTVEWLDSGVPKVVIEKLKELAKEIGYPLFMRTDEASGKHDYVNTCYVESEDKLPRNLYRLIEENFMHDLWPKAIVLREFIELDWMAY